MVLGLIEIDRGETNAIGRRSLLLRRALVNSASRGAGQAMVNSGGSGDSSEQMVGGEVSVKLYGTVGWASGVIHELVG
jgi:hypothetical protein